MLFFSCAVINLLGLRTRIWIVGFVLVLYQESAYEAEHHDKSCKSPSGFFQKVSGLSHTHDLVGGCEVGSQTTTFGVLNQYDESQNDTCDNY